MYVKGDGQRDQEPQFRTPSLGSTCLEVALISTSGTAVDEVRLRDSKISQSPEIAVSYNTFRLLERNPGEGVFSADETTLVVQFLDAGRVALSDAKSPVHLNFNADEWSTFVAGCQSGFFAKENYAIAA